MYRCKECGILWDDGRARDNEYLCTRRCGGHLELVHAEPLTDLADVDLGRLPYPVALTTARLSKALESPADALKTLFLLKDCFEASVKYAAVVLVADYLRSPVCTPERNEMLLNRMVRPSLGVWVQTLVGDLSRWMVDSPPSAGRSVARLFVEAGLRRGPKPKPKRLLEQCHHFVTYRNDALGHGAMRSDAVYSDDLREWLPVIRGLLEALAGLHAWRLCLVTDVNYCQLWMAPQPDERTPPGRFRKDDIGRFVLLPHHSIIPSLPHSTASSPLVLYPFLSYLPDPDQQNRLHFYDSIYRYTQKRKEVTVLEYDNGFKHTSEEPATGIEEAFTRELLEQAFNRHRGRMEVIEGQVANFGELIVEHADIVGRKFVIDHVQRFVEENDRGLLVIEAEPGKGKTAIMAHLVEEVFGHYAPPPAHFFYRRTAGITDPDVCVRSLYHALLEAHNIEESQESKEQQEPEQVFFKLRNLLGEQIAPRLSPSRPQLVFIDALDESEPTVSGKAAFQRVPEGLPAGVYFITTTRPVADRSSLARRTYLHWYDLDDPDLRSDNLRDASDYARAQLADGALSSAILDEVARVSEGNFLALKLLCEHIRAAPRPEHVPDFLRQLATSDRKDQLGFIYHEFWERLIARVPLEELEAITDVAGLLVCAHAPLTEDLVCQALRLPPAHWQSALRRLAQYLTIIHYEGDGEAETYYRLYHESFADFLRAQIAAATDRYRDILADHGLKWAGLPEGYARTYALRFGVSHLIQTKRWDDLETLLTDLRWIEAKALAGQVFEMVSGYRTVFEARPDPRLAREKGEDLQTVLKRNLESWSRGIDPYASDDWWGRILPFSSFVSSHAHQIGALPPDTVIIARNQAESGAVAEQAGPLCDRLSRPWLAWDPRPPAPPARPACLQTLEGHSEPVVAVAVTPDGKSAISANGDGTLRVLDLASGQCLHTLEGHSGLLAVAPDGRNAICRGLGGALRVLDLASGQCLRPLEGHSDGGRAVAVAVAPNGKRAIAAGDDEPLRVWDLASGQCLRTLEGHSRDVEAVAVTPDGKNAISGSYDETLRVWDLASGQCLRVLEGHSSVVRAVAVTPDGKNAISASDGGTLRLWNLASGQCLQSLCGRSGTVAAVAVTPDGGNAISAAEDGTLHVWDLASGQCLQTHGASGQPFEDYRRYHCAVAVTPDGKNAISTTDGQTVRVWDLASGQSLLTLEGRSWSVTPDGRTAIVGTSDRAPLHVWDLASGQCLQTLEGHSGGVTAVAVTPDGRNAISASSDRTLRVWDLASGQCLAIYHGRAIVRAVAVHSSSRIVCDSKDAQMSFPEMRNVESGPPVITGVRILFLKPRPLLKRLTGWVFARGLTSGRWDEAITSACQWCGVRFPLDTSRSARNALDIMTSHMRHLGPGESPCLPLPREAWADPRLLIDCAKCGRPLKLNPFMVDNREFPVFAE